LRAQQNQDEASSCTKIRAEQSHAIADDAGSKAKTVNSGIPREVKKKKKKKLVKK
jgi:hypothetical protein